MRPLKGNILPALFSGFLLSVVPVFADDEPMPGLEPPEPEMAFTVGLPIAELPASALVLSGDEMPVALPIGRPDGTTCPFKPIELSDEQFEKIHALKNQFLDAVGPKMLEISSKKRKLRDLLLASTIDTAAAKGLESEINNLKAEVNTLKLENKIDCLSVLTPEQRKNIRERAFRWQGHRHGHEHFKKVMMQDG